MNANFDSTGMVSAAQGIGSAEPSVAELQAQLQAMHEESESFRTLVRDRAIRGFRSGEWCLDVLNDTLRRLGRLIHKVESRKFIACDSRAQQLDLDIDTKVCRA